MCLRGVTPRAPGRRELFRRHSSGRSPPSDARFRTRPALPLERLRLEGRLVEAETGDLRLSTEEISHLLAEKWGRPPTAVALEFADSMLGGWPGAIHLWLAGLEDGADLMAPLRPG